MLRESDGSPVVTSYSVCEQFPGVHLLDRPKGAGDDWHERAFEMPHAERWEKSMAKLKASGRRLELKPDDWNDFHFSDGVTALDISAIDYAARLDRKLGIEASP